MSIVAGDILRVVASMLWTDGNVMQNVYNAVVTGAGSPWTDSDIVDDAEEWMDNLYANLTGDISSAVDGSEVIVYKYDAIDDDWDEVGSNVWGWNPTSAGSQLPRGVAALLNMKTTDPDVSGKKYVGGETESGVEDGLWGSGVIADLVLFGADWTIPLVGGTSGADWTPGIWSVVGTVFLASALEVVIPTIPAYQRRRKRGIGI